MELSNDLISQFVKITNDNDVETKKETTVYGTTVEHNGTTYVKLDGSELLTPISTTAATKPGERVTVMIKNHTATVTGNLSSPAARSDDVKDIAEALGVNNVLWSGELYMTEEHTAILSEAVSNQPNGIVLIFSEYIDGTSSNTSFHEIFVPKKIVSLHGGNGHCMRMSTSDLGYFATKYLYISDTQIVGHANNILTGSSTCGITRSCNRFIMRYVIGV